MSREAIERAHTALTVQVFGIAVALRDVHAESMRRDLVGTARAVIALELELEQATRRTNELALALAAEIGAQQEEGGRD